MSGTHDQETPVAILSAQSCAGWTRAAILIYASLVDKEMVGPMAEPNEQVFIATTKGTTRSWLKSRAAR
jgi:hypothetical protein